MLSYLSKFHSLPKNILAKINDPAVMASVSKLGQTYKLNLASTVMKVMVGEVKLDRLSAYLINEFQLSATDAKTLETALRREVFSGVIDFLLGPDHNAKLVFSPQDEQEVKAAKQSLATPQFDDDIDVATEAIAAQSRINFSDPLGAGKFRQVIKTYLRGSRDRLATNEALTKAAELGGLALNHDTAERVMIIADNFLQPRSKAALKTGQKLPVVEEEYDLTASLKAQGKLKTLPKPKSSVSPATRPVLDTSHELMPPVPALRTQTPPVTSAPESRRTVSEAVKRNPIDKPTLRKVVAATPPVENMPKSPSGKVKMDDIRYEAKALSPVEELRYFTLINLRRLDPDPVKAADKIKAKLELLGKENYSKKIEAIEAWNESPLNRLYLAVCRRSLEESLPLAAILEREIGKDKNFLKPDELSAIIALNKSLKF